MNGLPLTPLDSIDFMKPGLYLVEIDRNAAEYLLEAYNWHNRNKKIQKVNSYSRDMRNGRWLENGDSIRFAVTDDGRPYLADGQNRLFAVVDSDTTQQFLVVVGLSDEAQETMDRGATRTIADSARLRGIPNSNLAMAIAARAWQYQEMHRAARGGRYAPTTAELLDFYDRHLERFQQAVALVQEARSALRAVVRTVPGAAYFLCLGIDAGDANLFYRDQLIRALGLTETDPARALRKRLENMAALHGRMVDPDEAFRYMMVAWNAFRGGAKLSKLQKPRLGWSPDMRFQ